MSTAFITEVQMVRRKGGIAVNFRRTCDGGLGSFRKVEEHRFLLEQSSDRRARQIGKRHWLKKSYEWFASTTGAHGCETTRPPGKSEQYIQQPWST